MPHAPHAAESSSSSREANRHLLKQLRERLHNAELLLKKHAVSTIEALGVVEQKGGLRLTDTLDWARSVPDWARRAVRLSVCLVVFGQLGQTVHWPKDWAAQIQITCIWAAVTCVVVIAPLLGKAAEVSELRFFGTVLGGFGGLLVFQIGLWIFHESYKAGIWVVCLAPVMVFMTNYFGFKYSQSEALSKFVQLTYVIVAFASQVTLQFAALRMGGILAGGLLSVLLTVCVLPRCATVECCRELKVALHTLVDLNTAVWAASSNPVPQDLSKHGQACAQPSKSSKTKGGSEVDQVVQKLHSSLIKVQDMQNQMQTEIYVGYLWGSYFFLPSPLPLEMYGFKLPVLGKWHLPQADVETLVLCIRHITRLLYCLSLHFEEGWDSIMVDILDQGYPKVLMSEISLYAHKTLHDLHAAFPSGQHIEVDNLMTLGQLVECLIKASDTRDHARHSLPRTSAVYQLHKRALHPGGGSCQAQGSVDTAGPGPVPVHVEDERSSASYASVSDEPNTGGQGRELDSLAKLSNVAAPPGGKAAVGPVFLSRTLALTPAVRLMELPPRRLLRMMTPPVRVASPSSTLTPPVGPPDTSAAAGAPAHARVSAASAHLPPARAGLLPQPSVCLPPLFPAHTPSRPNVDASHHLPFCHNQRADSGVSTGQVSTLKDQVSAHLERTLLSMPLHPVVFPSTSQGYVAQVRWNSLQWLLDEFVEELDEAFLAVGDVMRHLPHPILGIK